MRKSTLVITFLVSGIITVISCSKSDPAPGVDPYPQIRAIFGNNIDPGNLDNYAAQTKPAYILKDNSGANPITNAKATLGRVLFYDKELSVNRTVSCGSCHKQEFAFSDTALISAGVLGGVTGRHSMRLVNSRFADEVKFFWNERAASLEEQTTQPVRDHAEMGFSGQNGRENINDLLVRLQGIGYYNELFRFVYGDINVTEARMQECLAQFIRSIQSFDSRFDTGRSQVNANNPPFPNFTQEENQGKMLFTNPPQFNAAGVRTGGGLGCAGCHRPPEFDIDPNSLNNGMILAANGLANDIGNTRAPSLRDLVQVDGTVNGPMMHAATIASLRDAVLHYNVINNQPGINPNLDPRLRPNGFGQQLSLNETEINAVVAFLRTLSGSNVYTDQKWSDPF